MKSVSFGGAFPRESSFTTRNHPERNRIMTKKIAAAAKKAAPKSNGKASKKTAAKKAPAKKAVAKDRAASVAASWKDPKVAAARAIHTKVKVGGIVYRSVPTAFTELGLPWGRMGRFRLEVKEAGRAVFTADDGSKHTFTTVAAE